MIKHIYRKVLCTKMKFSIEDFLSECDQIAVFCGFGHITEEILHIKFHFLYSGIDQGFILKNLKIKPHP